MTRALVVAFVLGYWCDALTRGGWWTGLVG